MPRAQNHWYLADSQGAFSTSTKPNDSWLLFRSQKKMPENSEGIYSDSLQKAQLSIWGGTQHKYLDVEDLRNKNGCRGSAAAVANLTHGHTEFSDNSLRTINFTSRLWLWTDWQASETCSIHLLCFSSVAVTVKAP